MIAKANPDSETNIPNLRLFDDEAPLPLPPPLPLLPVDPDALPPALLLVVVVRALVVVAVAEEEAGGVTVREVDSMLLYVETPLLPSSEPSSESSSPELLPPVPAQPLGHRIFALASVCR